MITQPETLNTAGWIGSRGALLGTGAVLVLATLTGAGWLIRERSASAAVSAPAAFDPAHAAHGPAESGQVIRPGGAVTLDPEMVRSLGASTVVAEFGALRQSVRSAGNVVYDETRLTTVTTKFEGFVERLYVDFTGQEVRRGQPLFEIYSPELVSAQEELLAALRLDSELRAIGAGAGSRSAMLIESARRRLLLWDISPAQVEQIERSGQVRRTLTVHAGSGGFVIEKMVQAGQAVDVGMPLYRLADLSSVWVEADVYERDLRAVQLGATVEVELAAYPNERFIGRVSYIHPEVRPDTRTARIRVELSNPSRRIKPGMYATVGIVTPAGEATVLVPRDAVMHSGTHAMVFVQEGPGTYRVREVVVGFDADGQTQILDGLAAGERVVKRANFLLDAETRLMESMGAEPGMNH